MRALLNLAHHPLTLIFLATCSKPRVLLLQDLEQHFGVADGPQKLAQSLGMMHRTPFYSAFSWYMDAEVDAWGSKRECSPTTNVPFWHTHTHTHTLIHAHSNNNMLCIKLTCDESAVDDADKPPSEHSVGRNLQQCRVMHIRRDEIEHQRHGHDQ